MTPITISFCGLSSIIKAENLKLYFPKAPQLRYQVWFVFCQSDPPSGTQNQSTGKWEPGSNTRNLFFWCRTNRNGMMALQATSLTETSWTQTEKVGMSWADIWHGGFQIPPASWNGRGSGPLVCYFCSAILKGSPRDSACSLSLYSFRWFCKTEFSVCKPFSDTVVSLSATGPWLIDMIWYILCTSISYTYHTGL